ETQVVIAAHEGEHVEELQVLHRVNERIVRAVTELRITVNANCRPSDQTWVAGQAGNAEDGVPILRAILAQVLIALLVIAQAQLVDRRWREAVRVTERD